MYLYLVTSWWARPAILSNIYTVEDIFEAMIGRLIDHGSPVPVLVDGYVGHEDVEESLFTFVVMFLVIS